MKTRRFLFARPGMGLCILMLAASALAQERAPVAEERSAGIWMAVGDKTLDDMRGGFDPGTGLLVTFGITRAVYINGDLVAQTTLNFGRINEMTPAQAAQLNQQLASLNLVQNGPRNTVEPQQGGANFGTIIQNTLDNQQIVNQTVINASSNAAGMVRNLNALSTVTEGVARAVGSR